MFYCHSLPPLHVLSGNEYFSVIHTYQWQHFGGEGGKGKGSGVRANLDRANLSITAPFNASNERNHLRDRFVSQHKGGKKKVEECRKLKHFMLFGFLFRYGV